MELQSGAISLKRAIDDGANPFYGAPLKAIAFFEQILSALAACKDRGIVHRDLSPANVLVLPDERVKLIDFGLCQIDGGDAVTLSDEGVGTPNYIAPECESGANDDVTWLADLYSAGKILWSAVTGKFAFARESRIFKEKSLEVMLPDCPNSWHLQHIFEKTVRHDPGDRWPTPQAAFEATRHVRSLIEQARPPLQLLLTNCPICGHGELSDFEGSYMVFGNPNPPGIVNSRCDYCGFCFARDQKLVREVTTKMQRLQ